MKFSKLVLFTLLLPGVLMFILTRSFASEINDEGFIKLLNESAVVLEQSHPLLASSLSKLAAEELNENSKENNNEPIDQDSTNDNDRSAHEKLLKDAVLALKDSHPVLAQGFTNMIATEERDDMKNSTNNEEKE